MSHRAVLAIAALVGSALVGAAGTVLLDGSHRPAVAATSDPDVVTRPVADERGGGAVRIRDPLLVVNQDGSTAVGAWVDNGTDVEVALMGIVVSVDGRPLPVNATPWWLPVPAGQTGQVGAASDAGGFVVPAGISDGTRARVELRFDDGTCVLSEVMAVARTEQHRATYPRTGRPIGPVTSEEPPAGTSSCRGAHRRSPGR